MPVGIVPQGCLSFACSLKERTLYVADAFTYSAYSGIDEKSCITKGNIFVDHFQTKIFSPFEISGWLLLCGVSDFFLEAIVSRTIEGGHQPCVLDHSFS